MAHSQLRHKRVKPMKYEMTKRREMFKAINDELEKCLTLPVECQPEVVSKLVSRTCYNNLCRMLDLPTGKLSEYMNTRSVSTIISYQPPEEQETPETEVVDIKASLKSDKTESSDFSHDDSETITEASGETVAEEIFESVTETSLSSEEYDAKSDFVEVETPVTYNRELDRSWKSVLKFQDLPEEEVATWRVKEAKNVSNLEEMTLEEQGDYLINKITKDFCDWVKKIGGDEKTFINEEIVKELFQIGMDNPASRAICVKMREKRVLCDTAAEFLHVPDKSFHEVLALHLKWDAQVEKKHSALEAFGKGLPKNLRFKAPDNKTAETWLEWNKLSPDQLSFADVYSTIKDLRSTREYCKWLLNHPKHKKPKYLVDQKMFVSSTQTTDSLQRTFFRPSPDFDVKSTITSEQSAFFKSPIQSFKKKNRPSVSKSNATSLVNLFSKKQSSANSSTNIDSVQRLRKMSQNRTYAKSSTDIGGIQRRKTLITK